MYVEAQTFCAYPCTFCRPRGRGCNNKRDDCGAKIISANWVDFDVPQPSAQICYYEYADRYSYLNITVSAPEDSQALGHFTFSDYNGHHQRILHDPVWASGILCGRIYKQNSNIYTSVWLYDSNNKPSNVWADVRVTVYWACRGESCASED
ncbi:11130_t:CDS:2, partial [Racocetra persica]